MEKGVEHVVWDRNEDVTVSEKSLLSGEAEEAETIFREKGEHYRGFPTYFQISTKKLCLCIFISPEESTRRK